MAVQPTMADLMTAISEVRVVHLETRADVAELRASLAEFRLATTERFDEVGRRLDTLFDELAAFHSEYNAHTHEEG